ncbi:MAG TPA: PHB depolymerase family esterase [Gemmataceae bacterium]|nr:PHB depolymerase family esterase [Gemmataceae bacterium]
MHLRPTILLGAVSLAIALATGGLPAPVLADVLVFKDGFKIEGRLKEERTIFSDPGGAAFSIPKNKPYWLDDGVRNIYFPPFQLVEAQKERAKKPDEIKFGWPGPQKGFDPIPPTWKLDTVGKWNDRWERELTMIDSAGRKQKVLQRITMMTPEFVRVDTKGFDAVMYFNTKEFNPQVLRDLVNSMLSKEGSKLTEPEDKELELRGKLFQFMLQAGFTDQAEKELNDVVREFPKQKSKVTPLLDGIKRNYAVDFVEDLKRAQKAGLHGDVGAKLVVYADRKYGDLLDESTQLQVQAIKQQHEAANEKIKDAQQQLARFAAIASPNRVAFYQGAAASILQELNADTVERLDIFLKLAADHDRALADKRQPDQHADAIMAFALTGWLRGAGAAEGDVEVAMKQWQARVLLLEYLRCDDPLVRKNKLMPALKGKVNVDEAMQFIKFLPPINAFDKIDAKPNELQTQNDGKQHTYYLQLPPGYHHGRTWPVLLVLHHSMQTAPDAMMQWAKMAARHGYIVAAPVWGKGANVSYQYTAQEHAAVLETVRDLRRRFQIDSDRVYMFGAEQGANMAFDVGMSHPDQFTGVMPMSGVPYYFARKYWPNAQYLHMYIVNGERSGKSAVETQALFKDFVKFNYPAIYIEYKGRSAELFGPEQPILFDWMDRKRRWRPIKEVGRAQEEFKTQRSTDNHFYWVSTSNVQANRLNSAAGWNAKLAPATLQASVFANNEVHIKTVGVSNVTLWFFPGMVNYNEKVTIRVNGAGAISRVVTPNLDTLLERLYETGDRQQLYIARMDF